VSGYAAPIPEHAGEPSPPPPSSDSIESAAPSAPSPDVPLDFDAVYEACSDLVWRGLVSLGIQGAAIDDAFQDVFLVVHRRLAEFEGRSNVRSWVFGIVVRVARDHRRRSRRKGGLVPLEVELVDYGPGPHEELVRADALRDLALILDGLEEERREIFVLAELEQLSAAEIASALGLNVNTVYSRIRAARRDFDAAVTRARRRER
jgi:RNA polymerase sigma-70 factor (ECF subfamily)